MFQTCLIHGPDIIHAHVWHSCTRFEHGVCICEMYVWQSDGYVACMCKLCFKHVSVKISNAVKRALHFETNAACSSKPKWVGSKGHDPQDKTGETEEKRQSNGAPTLCHLLYPLRLCDIWNRLLSKQVQECMDQKCFRIGFCVKNIIFNGCGRVEIRRTNTWKYPPDPTTCFLIFMDYKVMQSRGGDGNI